MKKLNFLYIAALVGLPLFYSCGMTDDRESKAHDYMQKEITDESDSALKLENFTKTNGIEQDANGMKIYSLEWQAQISVQKDVWKFGWLDGMTGKAEYFHNFKVQNNGDEDKWNNLPPHLHIGNTIKIAGNCQFQNTEKGWRVESFEVSTWQILGKDSASSGK